MKSLSVKLRLDVVKEIYIKTKIAEFPLEQRGAQREIFERKFSEISEEKIRRGFGKIFSGSGYVSQSNSGGKTNNGRKVNPVKEELSSVSDSFGDLKDDIDDMDDIDDIDIGDIDGWLDETSSPVSGIRDSFCSRRESISREDFIEKSGAVPISISKTPVSGSSSSVGRDKRPVLRIRGGMDTATKDRSLANSKQITRAGPGRGRQSSPIRKPGNTVQSLLTLSLSENTIFIFINSIYEHIHKKIRAAIKNVGTHIFFTARKEFSIAIGPLGGDDLSYRGRKGTGAYTSPSATPISGSSSPVEIQPVKEVAVRLEQEREYWERFGDEYPLIARLTKIITDAFCKGIIDNASASMVIEEIVNDLDIVDIVCLLDFVSDILDIVKIGGSKSREFLQLEKIVRDPIIESYLCDGGKEREFVNRFIGRDMGIVPGNTVVYVGPGGCQGSIPVMAFKGIIVKAVENNLWSYSRLVKDCNRSIDFNRKMIGVLPGRYEIYYGDFVVTEKVTDNEADAVFILNVLDQPIVDYISYDERGLVSADREAISRVIRKAVRVLKKGGKLAITAYRCAAEINIIVEDILQNECIGYKKEDIVIKGKLLAPSGFGKEPTTHGAVYTIEAAEQVKETASSSPVDGQTF
ncbi:MAG: hypothetical protein KAR32_01855, partial [Candidatus Omnitrophica bacterium]|nr:hypothetical protein [Candidatus Omnitrophota bacterium]